MCRERFRLTGVATFPGTSLFSSFTRGGDTLGGGVSNGGSISIGALTIISGNSPDNHYGC
jgi:hypothetical protein